MKTSWMHVVAFLLVIVGALNWGAVGLLGANLVSMLFGDSMFAQLVYVLVGVSGLYLLITHKDDCKTCEMVMGKKKGKR